MVSVRSGLSEALLGHVRKAERSFRGLPHHLHAELDGQIVAADLTKEKEAHRIDELKMQTLKEWAAGQGPERIWAEDSRIFTDRALDAVRVILGNTSPADELGEVAARVNLEELKLPPSERYRTGAQDILEKISKIVVSHRPWLAQWPRARD